MSRTRGKGRQKRPVQRVATTADKRPRLPIGEKRAERPAWRFGHCDHDGPWAWAWEGFHEHFEKLMDMEGKAWPEITHNGTIGAKRIPLDNLSADARRQLERLEFDDADALWELRVGGKPRLWGVRMENCFHFLWWDPEHEVCPSRR